MEEKANKESFAFSDMIPELCVTNYSRTLHFYTKILPFKVEYSRPEKHFAFLTLGGSQLMIEQVASTAMATDEEFRDGEWRTGNLEYPLGRGINLSIQVDDIEGIFERLSRADYPLRMQPRDAWYRKDRVIVGERQILVMDPDGYLLRFQQCLGVREA